MQTYQVQVQRLNDQHVQAITRDFTLTLGAKRGDAEAGMNPVQTLLSSMGACLLTALATVADLSRVSIDDIGIVLVGVRQDQPPRLTSVSYRLWGQTPVPEERLRRLVHMAERNSTVYQTLAAAVPVSGTVIPGAFSSRTTDER